MGLVSRRFPGGIFLRLVALAPLLFPLYVLKGVYLGVPITFTELCLLAMAFYFAFEHETLRLREWNLWPVFGVLVTGLLLLFLGTYDVFEGLKSWILFPALFFVMARSTFREKPSMILLSQKVWILVTFLMAGSAFRAEAPLTVEELGALSLSLAPALMLSLFFLLESRSKGRVLLAFFSVLFLGASLYSFAAYDALAVVTLIMGVYALLQLKWKGKQFLAAVIFLLGFVGLVFSSPVELRSVLEENAAFFLLSAMVLWTLAKALPWLGEKDQHNRYGMSCAFLVFVTLLALHYPSVALTHVYLFWLFAAILL